MDISNYSTEDKKTFQDNLDRGMAPVNAAPTNASRAYDQRLSTINSTSLGGGEKPVVLPTPTPSVSPAVGLGASAEASRDANKEAEAFAREQTAKLSEIQSKKQTSLDYLTGRNQEAEGFYKGAQDAMTSEVDPAQKELSTIRSEEADVAVRYRAEQDAIRANGSISKEGQQSLMDVADDKYGRRLADLAIRKSAAISNVADLRQSIKDKLELQLAPIEREQKFFKDFLESNFDDLKNDEKDRLNLLISERDKIKKDITDKENIGREALETALTAGVKVDDATVREINENPGQAYQILANKGYVLQDPLERQLKVAQIAKINNEIATSGGVTDRTVAESLGISPEQFADLPADTKNSATLTAILGSSKVGQGTKTQLANVLGVVNAARDLASARTDGKFKGLNPLQKVADFIFPEFLMTNEASDNRGQLDAINLKVQQWASGASLTTEQIAQVNRFTPSKSDSDSKVRSKLNNLTNFMLTQAQSQLQSEGVQYTPEKVNLFETLDLLNQATPEQKAQLKAEGLIQ